MKSSVVHSGSRSHSCLVDLVSFVPHKAAQHIYVQIAPITKYYVICYIKEEWLNTPPKGRQRHPLPCSGCDKVKRFTHGTLQEGGTDRFEFAPMLTNASLVPMSGVGLDTVSTFQNPRVKETLNLMNKIENQRYSRIHMTRTRCEPQPRPCDSIQLIPRPPIPMFNSSLTPHHHHHFPRSEESLAFPPPFCCCMAAFSALLSSFMTLFLRCSLYCRMSPSHLVTVSFSQIQISSATLKMTDL